LPDLASHRGIAKFAAGKWLLTAQSCSACENLQGLPSVF